MADLELRIKANQPERSIPGASYPTQDEPATTSATPDNSDDPSSPPGPITPRKSQPKPSNLFARLLFVRSKGTNDLAMQDLDKSRRAEEVKARKEAESRERKTRQGQEQNKREETKKASKDQVGKNKAAKAQRQAKEKKLKSYYRIRGYDPSAGMPRADRESPAGVKAHERPRAAEDIEGFTDARSLGKQHWGVEFGRPEQHHGKGHFSGHHESCGEHYGGRPCS